MVRARSHGRMVGIAAPIALFAGLTSSCLITTTPEFHEVSQTAPVILPGRVSPDPRFPLVVTVTRETTLELSALIQSEDKGEPLPGRMFSDYGFSNAIGEPYQRTADTGTTDPGTWADGPRAATGRVLLNQLLPENTRGCHRLTWVISHGHFDERGCPEPLTQESGEAQPGYAEVTWLVLTCDSTGCPSLDVQNLETECPVPTTSCVQATM